MDEVICWLSKQIYSQLYADDIRVWVFGSWVCQPSNANDCDVLILVDEKSISKLAALSLFWKQEFERRFGIPLHLTRLSFQEAETVKAFISAILAKPTIQLGAPANRVST